MEKGTSISTKGVGSLQLIGKLLCWRRNVWVIVSRTITSILHLMKELCPIPLLWIQNVSQSPFYDFSECTKSHFFFLAIVWWFLELKNRKKSKNLFEQMRKNVSTWFFMSFHEWKLCSLIQHDKKHLLALLTSSSAEIIVCIHSKVIYITWTWSPTFISKIS